MKRNIIDSPINLQHVFPAHRTQEEAAADGPTPQAGRAGTSRSKNKANVLDAQLGQEGHDALAQIRNQVQILGCLWAVGVPRGRGLRRPCFLAATGGSAQGRRSSDGEGGTREVPRVRGMAAFVMALEKQFRNQDIACVVKC